MQHWLERLDLGQKIVAFAATLLSMALSALGIRTWIANRRAEIAAQRQLELDRAVTSAVMAAMAGAEERAKAAYVEGARQEQANMLTLMEWTKTHEDNDDSRFAGLQHEVKTLREGQHDTHGMLKDMRKDLSTTKEGVATLSGQLDTIIRLQEHGRL